MSENIELTETRIRLPILPLRELVLFPGVSAPIAAGRPGTLRGIEAALRGNSPFVFAVARTPTRNTAFRPSTTSSTG